jgi:hypothetical protein
MMKSRDWVSREIVYKDLEALPTLEDIGEESCLQLHQI